MAGRFNADDYIDVQDRINRFWGEYPDGAIRTKLESLPDDFDICRYAARVFKHRDQPEPDATGWAFERAGGNGANSTSHEENCETSAIGRALANMGYATSRSDRPSRQEMQKAERHDGQQVPPRDRTTTQNTIREGDPLDFNSTRDRRAMAGEGRPQANGNGARPTIQNPDAPISDSQLNYIRGLAKQLGMKIIGPDGDDHVDEMALAAAIGSDYDVDWPRLTKGTASLVIEGFKEQLKQMAAGR